MTHHAGVTLGGCQRNGRQRFGERSDLVHLHQHAVGHLGIDALLQALCIGHEQVVSDQLHLLAERGSELCPAIPVVLGHCIFDRHDGVAVHEGAPPVAQLGCSHRLAFTREVVAAVLEQLAHRRVERNGDVLARRKTCAFHRLQQHHDCFFVAGKVRCKSAFVTHCGAEPAFTQHALQRMIRFHTPTQCFAER